MFRVFENFARTSKKCTDLSWMRRCDMMNQPMIDGSASYEG
ncbi:hypothetical protein FH063_004534 [Azospirillum argentinense]|uniref:Uncharacterized protein n=1 Tax=Azospirillum argentinense TaxID=2970906 RepID=A0A5B0KWR1_9PROT|nr:hypothetical protein FH063_004534 [Azospirillum argentinense]